MDKKKHTVKDALRQLKQYQPDEQVWERITADLDAEKSAKSIRSKLKDLPVYKAPGRVWDRVEAALDSEKLPVIKTGQATIFARKWMVAAATAGIIFLAGLWYFGTGNGEDVTITYSEEVINDNAFVADWDDDESAFEMVLQKCETTPADCLSEEFKALKAELLELNDVKDRIKQAIKFSGNTGELIAKLTKIELKRTKVLKKMISWG